MPVVNLDGLDIQFPFEPYDVQRQLMSKVIQCIMNRQNGLLESPTGTGKTASLLFSALSWQRKQKLHVQNILRQKMTMAQNGPNEGVGNLEDKFVSPKIIYASRTHSQLSQAVSELKRSYYKNTKCVIIGSRDQLCINEAVMNIPSASGKTMACHARVHARTCSFHNRTAQFVDKLLNKQTESVEPIMDIEDLVRGGKANHYCPFYLSKDLVKDADIIFMPYNYLLDPKLRYSTEVNFKNSIIILDEGHNIARVCEESVSFELKNSNIATCIKEVTTVINDYSAAKEMEMAGNSSSFKDLSLSSLVELKKLFLALEEGLESVEASSEGILKPGPEILSIIFNAGFFATVIPSVIKTLDAIGTFLTEERHEAVGCDKFSSILRILSSQALFRDPTHFGDSFKVFVKYEEHKQSSDIRSYVKSTSAKCFDFWCFNPSIGLEKLMLMSPRSIILASGTLSPLGFLREELQIPFPIEISSPHIIGNDQLFASILETGPGGVPLCSSYVNRSEPRYLNSLGELILSVCTVVPNGVLVFFPSYSLMEQCAKYWYDSGMWKRISGVKKLLTEPKGKAAFKAVMDDYYAAVKSFQGGCLFAVCRGKVSEGLDFTDDNARAVIITGIPYSPAKDPQVIAKQQYLDVKARGIKTGVNGKNWYQLEASRAMNQAVGRIIRHAKDYGAVLLCDSRIAQYSLKQNLSPWVRDRLKPFVNFDKTLNELSSFFGTAKKVQKMNAMPKMSDKFGSGTIMPTNIFNSGPSKNLNIGMKAGNSMVPKVLTNSGIEKELEIYSTQSPATDRSFSSNRTQTPQSEPRPKNIIAQLDLVRTESRPIDFTRSPVTFTKSFQAFSRDSPSYVKPKKKIKLAKRNNQFCEGIELGDEDSQPLTSSQPSQTKKFKSNEEFLAWIKGVLSTKQYSNVFKAIKVFNSKKNVNELAKSLIESFENKQDLEQCIGGLENFIKKETIEVLQEQVTNLKG